MQRVASSLRKPQGLAVLSLALGTLMSLGAAACIFDQSSYQGGGRRTGSSQTDDTSPSSPLPSSTSSSLPDTPDDPSNDAGTD